MGIKLCLQTKRLSENYVLRRAQAGYKYGFSNSKRGFSSTMVAILATLIGLTFSQCPLGQLLETYWTSFPTSTENCTYYGGGFRLLKDFKSPPRLLQDFYCQRCLSCPTGQTYHTYSSFSYEGNHCIDMSGGGARVLSQTKISTNRVLQQYSCTRCENCAPNCNCTTTGACQNGCVPGALSQNGGCYLSCPSMTYQSGTSCISCPANCSSCSSIQCLSCNAGWYLKSGACLSSCGDQFYPVGSPSWICNPCSATCLTCDNQTSTDCLSCPAALYYKQNSRECLTDCPSIGNYKTETPQKLCSICHGDCKTCSAGTQNNCLSCNNTLLYFYQGTCVAACPTNVAVYTSMTPIRECLPCHPSCQLCNGGPNSNQCTSCPTNTYLTTSNTCVSQCPDGYFNSPNPNICVICHAFCSICTGALNTQCSACTGNHFLIPDQTKCDTQCPSLGYHTDDTNKICVKCNSTCLNCTGPNNNQCTSCPNLTYLTSLNTCVSQCPDGFFNSPNPNICATCHPYCSICTGALNTQCSACNGINFLIPDQTKCDTQCPSLGYHTDDRNKICVKCNSTCLNCTGPNNNQCTSCPNLTYLTSSNTCVSQCPDGFFNSPNPNICATCHPYCSVCTGALNTQCSACTGNHFLIPDQTKCDIQCPSIGYYQETSLMTCLRCHVTCKSCTGSNDNQCTSCSLGRFKNILNICVLDCGARYWNDNITNMCTACHSTCFDCFGPSESSCISCELPLLLRSNNTCKAPCPTGSYSDDINPSGCSPCDNSCKDCFGPTNMDCSSCKSSYKLTPDKRCLTACEKGTFESFEGVCSSCFSSCNTCNRFGPRGCLTCQPGKLYFKSVGSCLEAPCPDRTFMSGDAECEYCAPYCKRCDDKKVSSCKECLDSAFLHVDTNICHPFCLSGYIQRPNTNICDPCHDSCGLHRKRV